MPSVTTTPVAAEGPALWTAMSNVSGSPMRADPLWDLTIDRFAEVPASTTSVAVLFSVFGSSVDEIKAAWLGYLPAGAAGSISTVSVRVGASAPAARAAVASRLQATSCPAPVTAPATQNQSPA